MATHPSIPACHLLDNCQLCCVIPAFQAVFLTQGWNPGLLHCRQTLYRLSHQGKNLPTNVGDPGSVPGSGRSSGEGSANPFQYSCLENPMDQGVWQAMSIG